jgi:uncharacterized damage-inducible protein DinB
MHQERGAAMNEVARWFERRFDFSFPVELLPNICVRLRGTPARLEELVLPAGREALIRKDGEKWSAQETAGHLLDLEPLWLARVEDFIAGTTDLTAADLGNRKTHEARHNDRAMADIVGNFRAERSKLLQRVSELGPAMFSRTALHPRLKTPMRLVDHLFFVAEHDDHHLAQIWNILRAEP